jgi:F420-dependent oxidoreductase-like protein
MKASIRLGLQIPSFDFPGVSADTFFERLVEVAVTAERSGFDSFFVMDHLHQIAPIGPETNWMLEGNTVLAAVAARTERLQVGLMVGGVTYRNPALHAKITTTLDVVSAGRAIHSIGAAWFEGEHRAYGFDFPPISERFERLEEHLQIARAMFTQESASFVGRHHRVENALNNPKPVRGDIPILVGGSGERKTLRLVAQYADASNISGDPDEARRLLGVLEGHCEAVGRDPAEITNTRLGTLAIAPTHEEAERIFAAWPERASLPEERLRNVLNLGDPDEIGKQVEALFDAGLDGLIFHLPNPWDLEAVALAGETLAAAAGRAELAAG